jgi:hypothetical protein
MSLFSIVLKSQITFSPFAMLRSARRTIFQLRVFGNSLTKIIFFRETIGQISFLKSEFNLEIISSSFFESFHFKTKNQTKASPVISSETQTTAHSAIHSSVAITSSTSEIPIL